MCARRTAIENRCQKCLQNLKDCFCSEIRTFETNTFTTIIMSASELRLTSNTATLANKCLSQSEILIRGKRDEPLNHFVKQNYTPIYLYPSPDSICLTQFLSTHTNQRSIQLVVPDGTWRQAKKIKNREPLLAAIPSVHLPKGAQSSYFLRTQKSAEGLCTFEAIARALAIIEGKYLEEKLLTIFQEKILRTLVARNKLCLYQPKT
jgi:DTW domain-containing protein YfiP